MANLNWLARAEELQPAALTVRAQAVSPNDNGRLMWDALAPRINVDSVDLEDVITIDDRPVADRREWNAPGRMVPVATPATLKTSIVPIEAYDKIDEKEMQKLEEGTFGNDATIQRVIGVRVPDRAERLALADYRRLEVDFYSAWVLGYITQRNPQDATKTFAASLGYDAGHYETALTAWDDPGVNAYDEFLAWYQDQLDTVGPGAGAMLRRATYNAILADAPDLMGGVTMTRAALEQRIQDDTQSDFRFYVNENSLDVFTDGGTAKTRTKVFPTQKVAYLPSDGTVGRTAFAPVVRAMELVREVGPDAGIDVRGVTVYYFEANSGKELIIEAQLNAVPIPDESKVQIIDAGV